MNGYVPGTWMKGINFGVGIVYCKTVSEIRVAIDGIYQVRDVDDNRYVRCEHCGLIGTTDEFISYGGEGVQVNRGVCYDCARRK